MRYDYKYRINNKDKGDLAMELKELTSAEQVVMKCIWDYGKDMPLQQLIENLKQDYGKDYKRTTIRTFVLHLEEKGYVTTYQIGKYSDRRAGLQRTGIGKDKEFLVQRIWI